ncbi:MAG: hypothetical protein BroJett013_06660 [Alphaproteobacteria bacterium]|nr:MAG: hypothetical protein BroJett013_06660 [Alphaproteobacteria bacterium]
MIRVYRYALRAPLDWGRDCEAEIERMRAMWARLGSSLWRLGEWFRLEGTLAEYVETERAKRRPPRRKHIEQQKAAA